MSDHVSDERLQEWADGRLSAQASARVEAHLATCASCTREANGLRGLLGELRALPRGITPGRDLYSDIVRRIDAPVRRAPTAVLRRAAAIVLLAGGATWAALAARSGDPVPDAGVLGRMQAEYARAAVALETALDTRRSELGPDAALALDESLASLDAALQEAGHALANDPGNPLLHELVLAGYEHKLDVLRRATDRTSP